MTAKLNKIRAAMIPRPTRSQSVPALCTLSSATTSTATPAPITTNPSQSRLRFCVCRMSGTMRNASRNPTIPIGTLIRKIQRHEAIDTMVPPTAGARTGAVSAGHVK